MFSSFELMVLARRVSLDDLIHKRTMNDLKQQWEGRLPTWEEYKKAPSLGPYEWITKETLVYRYSHLNPMSAVFDDVTNCDAGFD